MSAAERQLNTLCSVTQWNHQAGVKDHVLREERTMGDTVHHPSDEKKTQVDGFTSQCCQVFTQINTCECTRENGGAKGPL